MRWRFTPARDLGLSEAERLRSHVREPGLFSQAAQHVWLTAVRVYLRTCHRLAVEGRERLPAAPPYVLVASHASHLDALCLAACLPAGERRRAFALAAGEVFFDTLPAAGFAAMAVNALPVWRGRTTAEDLATLRARLVEDGLIYILFPEGTRSRTGEVGRFRPGVGALIAGGPVPAVPCALDGAFAAWPPQRRVPRPGRLRLRIGAPLRFDETANDRDGWMSVAAACEAAVRALQEAARRPER